MPSLDNSPNRSRPARHYLWRTFIAGLAVLFCLPSAALQAQQAPAKIKPEDVRKVLGLPEDYDNDAFKTLQTGFDEFVIGKFDTALTSFNSAAKEDLSLPPGNVMLARAFAAAQRMDQAKLRLELAASESPDSPEVYLTLARLALGEGRLTDALLEFNAAQAAKVKNTTDIKTDTSYKTFEREVLAGRAIIAQQRGNWKDAEKNAQFWLDSVKDGTPETQAQAELAVGTALFMLNENATNDAREKSAEAHLENAVKMAHSAVKAEDKDKAVMSNPKVLLAQLALRKAGDPKTPKPKKYQDMAEKFLKDAIAAPSGDKKADAAVESAYSLYLFNKNDVKDAQAHAEKATELDPTSDAFKKVMGLIDLRQKNFKEAADIFRELYRKSPGDFVASNNLALSLIGMGDEGPDETNQKMAEELALVNARADQKNAEALSTLGWILFKRNRVNEAAEILQAAISNNQATPDTLYYLAHVLAKRGRLNEARDILAQAVNTSLPFTYRDEAESWLVSLGGELPEKKTKSTSTSSSTESTSKDKEKEKSTTPPKSTSPK